MTPRDQADRFLAAARSRAKQSTHDDPEPCPKTALILCAVYLIVAATFCGVLAVFQ